MPIARILPIPQFRTSPPMSDEARPTEPSTEQSAQLDQSTPEQATPPQPEPQAQAEPQAQQPTGEQPEAADPQSSGSGEKPRRSVLIGSQRDPAAYRARAKRDWKPVETSEPPEANAQRADQPSPPSAAQPAPSPPSQEEAPAASASEEGDARAPTERERNRSRREKRDRKGKSKQGEPRLAPADDSPKKRNPPPSLRHGLPPELEAELQEAMGGEEGSIDAMLGGDSTEPAVNVAVESKHTGRVVTVRHEDVFVDLGGREQGVVSLKQFDEPPQPGDELEVIVQGFNADDGLYELSLPNRAIDIEDWSQLREGMIVQTQITGHNTGGLEGEVNHIRGFIPVSQISLYRVEDIEQFVGESWTCLVTEANEDRHNLVLSRRAVLEREREEAKQRFLEELQPGDVHEGTVRKILDFGAFVELGHGVDGLVHVSQLSWARVNHPSDVLKEGEQIKVQVNKVDHESGKIGLSCRDLMPNPWEDVERKYPEGMVARGRVSKLMDFGAFVELEPGVEGLVHVSELSHKRVWRPSDVLNEGDEVEVLVLSVDKEAERIGLSIKQLSQPEPSAADKQKTEEEQSATAEPADKKRRQPQPTGPLKGGLGQGAGGEQFGLKW